MGMIGNSLAHGLISGANIQDGTVDTPDLKDGAVTAGKINSSALKTINNASLLGTGNIVVGGGTATDVTTTASATNSNFKIPFVNTVGNTTGNYTYLHDSSTNFTYNPSTNTLNNVTLGTSVTVPSSILPTANSTSRGLVFGDGSSTDRASIGYGANVGYYSTAIGAYADASYSYSTALGTSSKADSDYSVAVGRLAWAGNGGSAGGSISVGHNTSSRYSNVPSTLIGHQVFSGNVSSGDGVIALRGTSGASVWDIPSSGFFVDTITQGSTSNALYFDATTKKITYAPGGGGGSLDALSDVTLTSPTVGQVLTFNGTAWVNADASGGSAEPETVVTTAMIKPTSAWFDSSSSGYSLDLSFSSPTEKTYMQSLFTALATLAGQTGQAQLVSIVFGGYSSIFYVGSSSNVFNSGSLSVGFNNTYYERSFTGAPTSENKLTFRVLVNAVISSTAGRIELALSSPLATFFTTAFAQANLPFSFQAYPGSFQANAIGKVISPSLSPVTGAALAATSVEVTSSLVLSNSYDGFAPISVGGATQSAAYLSFNPGATTYTQASSGGGTTQSYTPNWYAVRTSDITPSTPSYVKAFGADGNSIPLPSGWNGAPTSQYKVVGWGMSRAPYGEQFAWNTPLSYSQSFEGEDLQYSAYNNNPGQLSTTWNYNGYQTSGFAAIFLMPGPTTTGIIRPNFWPDMYSNTVFVRQMYANMVSHAPATQGGLPSSGLRYRLVAFVKGVPPSFAATLSQAVNATKFDQFLCYHPGSGQYTWAGFVTVNDHAVALSIAQNGFADISFNTQVNQLHVNAWFEV